MRWIRIWEKIKPQMTYKELMGYRCPWCGDDNIDVTERKIWPYMKFKVKCENCHHESRFNLVRPATIILGMYGLARFLYGWFYGKPEELRHYYFFGVLPLVLYLLFIATHIPLNRIGKTKEKKLGKSMVRWYPVEKGGIKLAKIRIIDNMIFPVCFLDGKGTPVSQTLCVRLHKRWCLFWKKAQVKLINDNLWKVDRDGKTPWEKAEKFVIFNKGKIIGEGILRSARTNDRQIAE